jgi:hypothetical protein
LQRSDGQAKVGGLISAVGGSILIALYEGPAILGGLSGGTHSTFPSEGLPNKNDFPSLTASHLGLEPWQHGVIYLVLSSLALSIFIALQVRPSSPFI